MSQIQRYIPKNENTQIVQTTKDYITEYHKKPYSKDAEQAVLKSILSYNKLLYKVKKIINFEHFYYKSNAVVYKIIYDEITSGNSIDILVLKQILAKKEILSKLDKSYLIELVNLQPIPAMVERHAMIILEHSIVRKLTQNYFNSLERIKTADNPIDVIRDDVEFLKNLIQFTGVKAPDEVALSYKETLMKILRQEINFYITGIKSLDAILGGFFPGEMVLIGARPSVGKTALGTSIAYNQVYKYNMKVHFVSVEMSEQKFMNRLVTIETKITARKLKSGDLTEQEIEKVDDYLLKHSKSKFILDCDLKYIEDIMDVIRERKDRDKAEVFYIDHLQVIRSKKDFRDNKNLKGYISNSLRDLAKELDVPIILLVQLNRDAANRKDKKPIITDLRDSGDLEQDATQIILLNRPERDGILEMDDGTPSKGVAEALILKNRDDDIGIVKLAFEKQRGYFKEYNSLVHNIENEEFNFDEEEEPKF